MKLFFLFTTLFIAPFTFAQSLPLDSLKLPQEFKVSIYADSLKNARQMCLGDKNIVFVGSAAGNVYAVVPDNKSKNKIRVITIAHDLDNPTGVACHKGALYVAEVSRISRFDQIAEHLDKPPVPTVVTTNLPNTHYHDRRVIRIGPDEKIYIAVGAPCNVCLKDDPRFATILRMNLDGSQQEIFASGIRNTVGFDWDPITHHLWFTDNGRDWLGDNLPPDELNYAPKKSMNFGFPYYYGNNVLDPVYGKKIPPGIYTIPKANLPAHVAALGMTFYSGKEVLKEYQNQILIAEHGSWNRTSKVGYQITIAKLSGDRKQIISTQPFITGWLQKQNAWGRPNDVLVMPDGSFLISDDYANVIYRISYK